MQCSCLWSRHWRQYFRSRFLWDQEVGNRVCTWREIERWEHKILPADINRPSYSLWCVIILLVIQHSKFDLTPYLSNLKTLVKSTSIPTAQSHHKWRRNQKCEIRFSMESAITSAFIFWYPPERNIDTGILRYIHILKIYSSLFMMPSAVLLSLPRASP